MYEMLDIIRSLNSELLRDFPKIRDFMSRVEALPAIKKYMDSDKFLKAPLFNKIAGYYKTNK